MLVRIGSPGLTAPCRPRVHGLHAAPSSPHTGLMCAGLRPPPPSRAPLRPRSPAPGRCWDRVIPPRYPPHRSLPPLSPCPALEPSPAPRSQSPHVHSLAHCWPLPTPSGQASPEREVSAVAPHVSRRRLLPAPAHAQGRRLVFEVTAGTLPTGHSWGRSKPSLWVRDHIPPSSRGYRPPLWGRWGPDPCSQATLPVHGGTPGTPGIVPRAPTLCFSVQPVTV